MNTGKFIVIEGIDGTGKTELAYWLARELVTTLGHRAKLVHEPGSIIENEIRCMFKRSAGPPSPDIMTALFTADRLLHMESSVCPALRSGVHVISDRHKLSTLVYQTVNGASSELVNMMVDLPQPEPDLTIILDMDPAVARARMEARNSKLDSYERDIDRQRIMRALYLEHRSRFGPSVVIDASEDRASVRREALYQIMTQANP